MQRRWSDDLLFIWLITLTTVPSGTGTSASCACMTPECASSPIVMLSASHLQHNYKQQRCNKDQRNNQTSR